MPGRAFRLGELVEQLGGELAGDPAIVVAGVGTLGGAGPDRIAFLTDGRYRDQLAATRAAAVILAPADRDATGPARIVTPDPYTYFAHVARLFHPAPAVVPGVHATAVIAAGARIAATASIGPGSVVEDAAEIGAGAALGPGCVIGASTRIGAGTTLHAGVRVYRDCVIGARCIVHAGVVIGADGFGFAPVEGRWLKIPQTGRVVIGDDVEIGANSTIDRGAIDDTVIEDGVKLDNQLQIGHNVRIGAHTAIAGCVGIAGSTSIGRHCMIGGAAMIGGHLAIADRVVIAGATTVTKSITAPGTYLGVLPAAPAREWRKTLALLRNLDRMATRLRALEARLALLENNK